MHTVLTPIAETLIDPSELLESMLSETLSSTFLVLLMDPLKLLEGILCEALPSTCPVSLAAESFLAKLWVASTKHPMIRNAAIKRRQTLTMLGVMATM